MSKSEWEELPDWSKLEEYAFMDGATREERAWEFLRRNPEYRADWLDGSAKKSVIVYDPPKREDEVDDKAWKQRVWTDYGNPIKTTMDKHIARKWWLQALYDPLQSFSQGVSFRMPEQEFPRRIVTPEQFEDLLEEGEMSDGSPVVRVANRNAVFVFDVTQPVTDQIIVVKNALIRWQKEMIKAGLVVKGERHAGKIDLWKRHLQVLDAQRMNPDIDYLEIGKFFWINKPTGTKPGKVRSEGKKFYDAALSQMKLYKKILLFKDTTGKIKKS